MKRFAVCVLLVAICTASALPARAEEITAYAIGQAYAGILEQCDRVGDSPSLDAFLAINLDMARANMTYFAFIMEKRDNANRLGLDYSGYNFSLEMHAGVMEQCGKALYDGMDSGIYDISKVRTYADGMVAWYNEYAKTTQAAD